MQQKRAALSAGTRPIDRTTTVIGFNDVSAPIRWLFRIRGCDEPDDTEMVNSTLKRKYGAFVRSQRWWKQFRELTIACLVHNLDRSL